MRKTFFIAIYALVMAIMPKVGMAGNLEVKKDKFQGGISSDFVSSYIWRGQDLGGISIQPYAYLQYSNVKLDVWGNVGFESKDTKEIDISLGYSWKGLNISVIDYFFSGGEGFFNYKAHSTSHVFEGHIGYDFGLLAIDWYTNFAGNDGINSKGKRAYSTYIGISAPFKFVGLEWKAEVGINPWATSYYNVSESPKCGGTNGFEVCNISLGARKEIKITNSFTVPLFAKFTVNPRTEGVYFVAGFSL